MANLIDTVISAAKQWVGDEFAAGESAQCANFVRHVFASCDYPLPSAAEPSDLHLMPGMPLAPSFANSFAGDEVGRRIPRDQVRRGDLFLFRNTYGAYPRGVITHVGIATGPDTMIDRSTSSQPVRERNVNATFPGLFVEARRPHRFNLDEHTRFKLFFNEGRLSIIHGGAAQTAATLKVFAHDGKIGVSLNGEDLQYVENAEIQIVYMR